MMTMSRVGFALMQASLSVFPGIDIGMIRLLTGKENDSLNASFSSTNSPLPHPSHIPYNPKKHVNSKPPYSFSCLIFMAIEDSPDKKLPVKVFAFSFSYPLAAV